MSSRLSKVLPHLKANQFGVSVPPSYGDVAQEYAVVRDGGAGLFDLSSRGRLLVTGSEAVQFLNGLITNDMKTLAAGNWMPAAFPNVQGRLIASVRVVRLADDDSGKIAYPVFLIDTEAATHQSVRKLVERFTLAGDFHVRDITDESILVSVQGGSSTEVVSTALGSNFASQIAEYGAAVSYHGWGLQPLRVVRASHTGEVGFDLIVDRANASYLWNELVKAGARPVGYDALEILRIEAGVPRYGIDMDDTNIVTETNLDDAVSYTKGCYIGQEIIARIKYRGHVAKKLSGLIFEGTVSLEAGAIVHSAEGKEIGRITSVTDSPKLNRTIALAYLKYDYLAAETLVKVAAANQELSGKVVELPFVP